MSTQIVTELLREPGAVAARCQRDVGLRELSLTTLICLTLGSAVFGGVLCSFRGGLQIGFSALKLPLALLATLMVCVPAFHAFTVAFGGRSRFASVAVLTLSAAARAALVLLACAPVLWLAVDRGLGYHRAVVVASLMYGAAGLASLGLIVRGLGGSLRAWLTAAACGLVFLGVLGQTAWMLRPFFGRPSERSVPLLRAREGSFADAVRTSSKSAAGIYERTRTDRAR